MFWLDPPGFSNTVALRIGFSRAPTENFCAQDFCETPIHHQDFSDGPTMMFAGFNRGQPTARAQNERRHKFEKNSKRSGKDATDSYICRAYFLPQFLMV